MKFRRNLVICLSLALPFALGCSDSTNLSSKGQMIECQVAPDGTVGSCAPVSAPSGAPGTCVDKDEDGDGEAHDGAEADDDAETATADDDDGDGIDDADDCDELPGEDSDDGA